MKEYRITLISKADRTEISLRKLAENAEEAESYCAREFPNHHVSSLLPKPTIWEATIDAVVEVACFFFGNKAATPTRDFMEHWAGVLLVIILLIVVDGFLARHGL